MTIKTFRGKLEDGGQDQIYLAGDQPGDGYRILKFQLMPSAPGVSTQEIVGKIWKRKQTTVNGAVDFNDTTLLAAAIFTQSADSFNSFQSVIFDNTIVNQDIYVTIDDSQNAAGANYYIELEQVIMPKGEQAVVNFNAALIHGD